MEASYTEMEEFLKAVATQFGELPRSANWHRDLLTGMATSTDARPAVISLELLADLDPLLAFRHVGRYATFPTLDWEKMQPLIESLGDVAERFLGEADAFLLRIGA